MAVPSFVTIGLLACGLMIGAAGASATGHAATTSAEDRRAELAKVGEMLSDPDPLVREANVEAIMESGDETKMRLTMRIVLSGADKELKVLAIRYYMTLVKGFVFDINLPAASQAAYDRVKESQSKVDELRDQNPLIALYLDANATVHMNITQYSFADRAGRWVQPGMEQQGGFPFQVTQDGLRSDMGFAATGKSYNCSVSLHPTDALTMEGTMRCIGSKGSLPPISLSATLF